MACINEFVVQELPRVEEQLVELLNHYESNHGHTLFIDGRDYRLVVSQQWVDYEEQKENEKLQRVLNTCFKRLNLYTLLLIVAKRSPRQTGGRG